MKSMKQKELFTKTIGILVKAYFDKTLAHGDCACCAVGNLVCAGYGDVLPKNPYGKDELSKYRQWGSLLAMGYSLNMANAERNIEVTGYTIDELTQIEGAFEDGYNIHWTQYGNKTDTEIEQSQYNGLMRVVDTLMLIHEANETEVKQAKELFVLA
jgi:hypothetical protein